MLTVQIPSLQKQTFLLAHCCWGTFHEEERLPALIQKFHTLDDIKSVRNLVTSADWTTK